MAVYVSNPAGRLGRYYSRGKSLSEVVPMNATEAFETFTGVWDVKKEARMSRMMKKQDLQAVLLKMEEEDLEVIFESDCAEGSTATIITEELLERTASQSKLKKSK
jgi:SHS2 domain-containing protein